MSIAPTPPVDPQSRRTRSSSEEVRERLLNAAAKLFAAKGIQAVGVDEICECADVAKMSLYKHFKGKDQLIAAYLQRVDEAFLGSIEKAIGTANGDARAGVGALFEFLYAWFQTPEFRGCPFLNAAAEFADVTHPARSVCLSHKARLQETLARLVREMGKQDVEPLASQLLLLMDGAVLRAQMTGSPESAQHARLAAERLIA